LERRRRRDDAPPAATGVTGDDPAPFGLESPGLLRPVERADRLRRRPEGRVVLVYPNVGQQADDRPLGYGGELRLDQRSALGLCRRGGGVAGGGRPRGGAPLLPQQLVPDLRPVSVRDDEVAAVEQRPHRLAGLAKVRALLGRRPTLARPRQRVAA